MGEGSAVLADLDVLEGDGHEILYKFLMGEMRKQYVRRREDVKQAHGSVESLIARQEQLRDLYKEMIGDFPEKTPLNPMVTGNVNGNGYRIENVIYESRPRHRVTANLYLPITGNPPWPGVLFACGHTENGKASKDYQAVCALMAQNGLVALSYDPICQGERFQIIDAPRHGTTTHTLLNIGSLFVGQSVVGYEAWDGIRSIDYLLSRPEVDDSKPIGMTGTSGGGTQTTFLMALDDRIGPVAPSCYVMTRQRKFETLGPADGCQNLPFEGAFGFDHADYLTMHAPEPAIILAARQDYFDIDGVREAADEVGRVYKIFDLSEHYDLFESDDSHGFLPPHRQMAVSWMRRWLLNEDNPVVETVDVLPPDSVLYATDCGQILDQFEDERTIADLNLDRARNFGEDRRRFWRSKSIAECLAEVKQMVGVCDDRGIVKKQELGTLPGEGYEIRKLLIQREDEVEIPAFLFIPEVREVSCPATIYVDGCGKKVGVECPMTFSRWAQEGRIILSLDVRGIGETVDLGSEPKYYNLEQRVSVLALHIGRPLLGQRIEDVLTAMDVLEEYPEVDGTQVDLVGIKQMGPVVLHAAAFDDRFKSVTLNQSICSWVEDVVGQPLQPNLMGQVVPSALKKYDLPDLIAAIAPRDVIIQGA